MGNSDKVVDLSSNQRIDTRSAAVLSELIQKVHNVFIEELSVRFEALFADTDDHLFDKSSKSEDSRHFSALRTIRVKKSEITKAFLDAIKEGFVDVLGKRSYVSDSDEQDLSFESLALVEEGDLEERIALDSMGSKALKNNKLALDNLCKRLDAIASNVLIHEENNPMAPEKITSGFSRCLANIDLETEFKLIVYKFFERSVIQELDLIYDKVNQLFIDEGILPDLKIVPVKQRSSSYSSSRKQEESLESNDQLHTDIAKQNSNQKQDIDNNEVLSLLGELLSQRRGQESYQPVSQQIETPQLINVLSNLQGNIPATIDNQLRDIREQISGLIPGQIGGQIARGALGQSNDNMIDVVTMLFDFILDDENLQAEIKALIARLQIPILKVGLTDSTFFSNRKHSARLLLNELAHAGLSWDPTDPTSQPMLGKIQQIVERVCNEFVDQIGFFDDLLADFSEFKSEFRRRANIFEKRTREAEEGKAKAETARSRVNEEIRRICRNKQVPRIAKQIFKNVWSHVMFLESLRECSENFEKVTKIARMMVWSLQAKKNQEELDKLRKFVPVLIRNLKLGFNKISYSQIDSSRLLDELEVEHRNIINDAKQLIEESQKDEIIRLKPKSLYEVNNEEETQKASEVNELPFEEVEVEEVAFSLEETGQPKSTASAELALTPESKQTVEGFSAGSWFDLKIDEDFRRTKLAARIVSTGKYIFVNRSGVKVAEFHTDELAAAYQLGEIKILDDEALFDRALKAVISNLREMKAES